jgi:hypothetical protein
MRISYCFVLLVSFILVLPCAARAASGGDVYFGYSRLGANAFNANTPGLNGWQAAGQVKLIPFVGVDLDVAHYGLGAAATLPHSTTVMIGPRVTVGVPGVHIFGHGLLGAEHSSNSGGIISSTALTVDAGAGADFTFLPFLAWRISADYINAPNQSPNTADRYRFGTGLALHF